MTENEMKQLIERVRIVLDRDVDVDTDCPFDFDRSNAECRAWFDGRNAMIDEIRGVLKSGSV